MNCAIQLDPVSPIIHVAFAGILVFARKWDEAVERCHRALELEPGFLQARWMLGLSYLLKGMHRQEIEEFSAGIELTASAPLFLFALGYAYGFSGE